MTYWLQSVLLPLMFSFLLMGAAYWSLGLLPVPRPAGLSALMDRWGGLEVERDSRSSLRDLLLISAAGLFLELLLVRWVSSEIRIFAYFKNMVLVACFFGFGLGCYLSRRRVQLTYMLVPLLALAALLEFPWHALTNFLQSLSEYVGGLADVHVFGRHFGGGPRLYFGALLAFAVITPVAGLVALVMVPVGQMVARHLEIAGDGISAYSANVAASIAGIWMFTGICFLSSPPQVWFGMMGLVLAVLFWRRAAVRNLVVVSFVLICAFVWTGQSVSDYRPERWFGISSAVANLKLGGTKTFWSPYQKLTLTALTDGKEPVRYVLNTNGSWYQDIMNLDPQFVRDHPLYYEELTDIPLSYHRYNLPYRFVPPPESVLILGAGMGNDVAAALRNGAKHVVAVEIDPLIQQLGREYNLEHAYQNRAVVSVVDDARSYVQNTDERFDLIVSSILDSHTTQSSFTNIRTDNYVYTREGIEHMQRLLKPGGLLSLSFNSERPWFASRIRDVMTSINGRPPLMVYLGANFFLVGNGVEDRVAANAELRGFVQAHPLTRFENAAPTTDDWPYFYQRQRGVPMIVALFSALLLGVCWVVLRRAGMETGNFQWHFFYLGAGFMLMEVQIISKIALLFGTTWLVNSVVITALLFLILLANATVARFPAAARTPAYVGLFLTLAICWWVPVEALLLRGALLRAVYAMLLLCSPVYFAGLIFTSSFAKAGFRAEAFGANLFGAVIGGLLEALSFWTGIRSLVVVAAGCYLLALLARGGVAATGKLAATVPSAPAAAPS